MNDDYVYIPGAPPSPAPMPAFGPAPSPPPSPAPRRTPGLGCLLAALAILVVVAVVPVAIGVGYVAIKIASRGVPAPLPPVPPAPRPSPIKPSPPSPAQDVSVFAAAFSEYRAGQKAVFADLAEKVRNGEVADKQGVLDGLRQSVAKFESAIDLVCKQNSDTDGKITKPAALANEFLRASQVNP